MKIIPHPVQGANRPVRRSPEGKTIRGRIVELEFSNDRKSREIADLIQEMATLVRRVEKLEADS